MAPASKKVAQSLSDGGLTRPSHAVQPEDMMLCRIGGPCKQVTEKHNTSAVRAPLTIFVVEPSAFDVLQLVEKS